jgi:hypothetical protein
MHGRKTEFLTIKTAHPLNVTSTPNLSKHPLAPNGNPTPAALFADHITPYANPFLLTNHSSKYSVDGVNSNPFPIAHRTP